MMAGRLIRSKIVLALGAALACAGLGAGSATAGTLTLNFNAWTNGGFFSGCNLWSMTPQLGFGYDAPCSGYGLGMYAPNYMSIIGAGSRFSFQTIAPPGITITSASVAMGIIQNINDHMGWGGGSFYAGGAGIWHGGDSSEHDGPINSSYWGFAMICGWAQCSNQGSIYPADIVLTATENQGPSLTAVGGNNLWYQGGHYIWNPPGDPWPLTLDSSDPSGVCSVAAYVGNAPPLNAPQPYQLATQWQQCEERTGSNEWAPAVDTTSLVPSSGSLPVAIYATNAASVTSGVSETLNVDNDPVGVSFSTPNDPNPSVWVNHAVTVDSSASAGPSGVGGESCSVDGGGWSGYPASGLSVDGTGAHRVSCTAWNNAVDPQGNHNSGSSSMTVRIDETPPALGIEPQNPSAPTNVVVDTSDSESGVAGGSVKIAAAGTQNWASVPTSFDGQHLVGHINDAGLSGPYTVQATSCDNVGNCSSTAEALTMPLRVAAVSQVSFQRIAAPAKVVRRRVLVGWRWQRIRINGRLERVRVGGHFETIRIVIGRNALCAERRVRTGPHRWREIRVCRQLTVRLVSHERVAHGRSVAVNGALVSAQGVPIAGARVRILTSPDNGLDQFTQAAVVTTSTAGGWSVTLPAGPSGTIAAVYDGSGRLLPAVGEVSVSVPARISLSVTPRAVPWNGTIALSGRLDGGWIPPDGVALRLLIRYAGIRQANVLLALRTDSAGRFRIQFRFPGGGGVQTLPFWVATTATESDYPFAPASSRHVWVTFGRTTPAGGGGASTGGHHTHHQHPGVHHRRHRRRS